MSIAAWRVNKRRCRSSEYGVLFHGNPITDSDSSHTRNIACVITEKSIIISILILCTPFALNMCCGHDTEHCDSVAFDVSIISLYLTRSMAAPRHAPSSCAATYRINLRMPSLSAATCRVSPPTVHQQRTNQPTAEVGRVPARRNEAGRDRRVQVPATDAAGGNQK